MTIFTCASRNISDYYQLFQCPQDSSNFIAISHYIVQSVLSVIFAIFTYAVFNSVTVLNYRVHVSSLSNNLWILYFVVVSVRSAILSAQYVKNDVGRGFFLSSGIIGVFEVLVLCLALNYQRKYRSSAYIGQEIDTEDRYRLRSNICSEMKVLYNVFGSIGILVTFLCLLAVLFILLYAYEKHFYWFWVYVALLLSLEIAALVISCLIAIKFATDDPKCTAKICFILCVLLSMLELLPVFVWNCVKIKPCFTGSWGLLDVLILLKILSLGAVFLAIYLEYKRLKYVCQFALLNEVQTYSVE